jgi:hypothetical protein
VCILNYVHVPFAFYSFDGIMLRQPRTIIINIKNFEEIITMSTPTKKLWIWYCFKNSLIYKYIMSNSFLTESNINRRLLLKGRKCHINDVLMRTPIFSFTPGNLLSNWISNSYIIWNISLFDGMGQKSSSLECLSKKNQKRFSWELIDINF